MRQAKLFDDFVVEEDGACRRSLRGDELQLRIEVLTEEANTRTEDDGLDGEEEFVDDACFHEGCVDLGAAGYSDSFCPLTFQTLHEIGRGLLCRLDERVTVDERASFRWSECFCPAIDDVSSVFEWFWEGGECRRTENDDAGVFRQTNKSAFVLLTRPIEWRMPGISRDEAIGGESGDDESGHRSSIS